MSKNWSAEDFWQFSLGIYAIEDVKETCLALQNDFSVNVNILLLCGYLNLNNRQLSKLQFVDLSSFIAPSVADVEAIRQNRIVAKMNQPSIYSQLLADELALEKLQQQNIIHFLNQHQTSIKSMSNLQVYLSSLDKQGDPDLECKIGHLDDLFSLHTVSTNIVS